MRRHLVMRLPRSLIVCGLAALFASSLVGCHERVQALDESDVNSNGANAKSEKADDQEASTTATGDATASDAEGVTAQTTTTTQEKKYPVQKPELGSIEGRIVLEGLAPKIAPIDVPSSNKDHAACAKHVKSEVLTLSKDNGILNVVVSLDYKRPKSAPAPPKRTITVDNKQCTFVPHVQATTKGSTLRITNSDAFLHNTRGALAASFNTAITGGGELKQRLRKEGWLILKCDFHPWMTAHVQIFDHEFFDVTGSEGSFKIPNIPPGEYDLRVWHERLAFLKGKVIQSKVTVEAGKPVKLDLRLAAPTRK